MTQQRLNIAVFIDFDNIEIGIKSTLGQRFDVGAVLEALKERGEVVTKVAYGDWTRAGDYSRSLTQHAVRMVQRNLTPGGDKNGADINLALDALEMAFTHDHINAFVIVGGDSDFITLVEKLKQYDKTVFVVGGRAFTSLIMQKNCHEFIAYENLLGASASRRPAGRGRVGAEVPLSQAFPLVRRALKVLADREVSPQLGLLKSTLLQLDSAFSEREYGASTFRDFVQKLAKAGLVNLKGTDRSLIVELRESDGQGPSAGLRLTEGPAASAPGPDTAQAAAVASGEAEPFLDSSLWADGVRVMHALFLKATTTPRWPMYLRNLRQFLKAADEGFDERRYGFRGIIDAARIGQREGLFRVERDRRGVLRVFPGPQLQRPAQETAVAAEPAVPANGDATGADQGIGEAPGVQAGAVLVDFAAPESSPTVEPEKAPTALPESEVPVDDAVETDPPAGPAKRTRRRAPSSGVRRASSPRSPRRPRTSVPKP